MTASSEPRVSLSAGRGIKPAPRRRRREHGWLWFAPALVLVLAFTGYPLYFALTNSFFETKIWTPVEFVGFDNYAQALADPRFHANLWISAIYVFGGALLAVVIGTLLALALRRPGRRTSLIRAVILIPWITSEVVVGITWRWLLEPNFGPLGFIWEALGWGKFPPLLSTPATALTVLTLVNVWRAMAFPMLMSMAALQSVPRELEEAAAVDGANAFQRVTRVILPIIMPTLAITVIVMSMHFLNMVVLIIDLTGGGPAGLTEVLGLRVYREAFEYFNVDMASVFTLFTLLINMSLAVVYFLILKKQAGGEL